MTFTMSYAIITLLRRKAGFTLKSFTMLIQHLSKGEKLLKGARIALSYALTGGLIVLSGYLGFQALELRTDLRVQNAQSEARIQVLQGELEHLKATEAGLKLEADALSKGTSR